MKKYTLIILITVFTVMPNILAGQKIINKDERISHALSLVNTDNLKTTVSDLVSKNTRHNLSTRKNPSTGIGAAAEYLYQRLNSYKSGASHMSVQKYDYNAGGEGTRLGREITLSNIVADFKGINIADDRVIILLAHYDSRSFDNSDSTAFAPGANDNGSGVSALLEIARILSATPLPVSVKIMFLSGEEHGLLGAAHMASLARKGNWNIEAVLNNDMIGNSRSSGTEISDNTRLRVFSENIPFSETAIKKRVREFNSGENDSESRQLARYIKEISERYVENLEISLIYRNDRFGRGGDHTPFSREGFTSIRLCEYYENYDRTHQIPGIRDGKEYGDVISGVDFEYVRKNSMANLSSLMNLAFAPQKPINPVIDISALSSSTKISWEPPKGGDIPVGYYILIRETDKSNWEKKIFIRGTSAELSFSKDNHFFAVQSVSAYGNESLPVFAVGGSAK